MGKTYRIYRNAPLRVLHDKPPEHPEQAMPVPMPAPAPMPVSDPIVLVPTK